MPLLDIATAQPCFQNNIHAIRSQSLLHTNFVCRNDKRLAFPWKSFSSPGKANNFNLGRNELWRGRLVVKAVATLEHTKVTQTNKEFKLRIDVNPASSGVTGDVYLSSSPDLAEVNEREKLRRMRISKANKGIIPWNKGRKHSPETLQRIKERTRLAMQDPKVKMRMKLVNLGHAQSKETRIKIGVGVRFGWEKRREKLMVQETCHYDWQNLIAKAARIGLLGEEELQWNSYKILAEQLEQEWLRSVEERKRRRPKGCKRAPKNLEQRRKISEAIAVKWSDPAYRTRVYSGRAKYHGIPEVIERKPRKKPSGDGETAKRSPSKRKVDSDDLAKSEPKSQIQRTRFGKSTITGYKDPLVGSKSEMLENIRAPKTLEQRRKISEAITAKWSNPAYCTRVYSGRAKYHGIPEVIERKPRKKPSGDGETAKRSPSERKVDSDDLAKSEPKSQIERTRFGKSTIPGYKDPLVGSKSEMLENIRSQRAAAESKKSDAISRAKVLIAEAEKAAKALEVAAMKTPIAQASLVETRKLIAEAIQIIESTEKGQGDAQNDGSTYLASIETDSHTEDETEAEIEELNQIERKDLNGAQTSTSSITDIMNFNFEKSTLHQVHELSFSLVKGNENLYQMGHTDYDVHRLSLDSKIKLSSFTEQLGSMKHPNGSAVNGAKFVSNEEDPSPESATITKKWVCGRLVEVTK